MPDANALIELSTTELAAGAIASVSFPGEGGTTRTVTVHIPPGTEDGTVLHILDPAGDVYVRVSATVAATAPADPPASPLPSDPAPVASDPASPAAPSPDAPSPWAAATTPTTWSAPNSPPSFPPTGSFPSGSFPPAPAGWQALPPAPPHPAYRSPAAARRKVVLFTGIAAAVVVLVVALISANSGGGPAGPNSQTTQAAAPTTTTTPPESAAAYQQALNELATVLNNGLTQLNNAQTPAAITAAIGGFNSTIMSAEAAFGAVPPTNTATANTALVTALQGLVDDDLSAVSIAAGTDQLCLGPAATAQLSRASSLDQLRTVIATLTSGGLGYQFGAALPAVTQDGARTASTGSIVAGGVKHGLGQLTITNGADTDATVALVAGQGAPLVTVYMGHGGTYTLHHVPDGTYTIYVTSGNDWDAGTRLFSRNCQFEQFDQTMDFTTTSTEYTTYTITLTPVADGNATESDVDPGAFPH